MAGVTLSKLFRSLKCYQIDSSVLLSPLRAHILKACVYELTGCQDGILARAGPNLRICAMMTYSNPTPRLRSCAWESG